MKRPLLRLLAVPLLALLLAAALLVAAGPAAGPYFAGLGRWADEARASPEGPATAALFRRAVEAGAIAWNPDRHEIELKPFANMPKDLKNELLSVGEGGAIIAAELRRVRALGSYVAVRVRRTGCAAPCDQPVAWSVGAETASGKVASLAEGAAIAQGDGIAAPLPRTNFLLSRNAAGGYGPWSAWSTQGEIVLSGELADADYLDILGNLKEAPPGWTVLERWCRDVDGDLASCAEGAPADAQRLTRAERGDTIKMVVAPVSVVSNPGKPGVYYLSDRLVLRCDADARCLPDWIPASGERRYARGWAPALPATPGAGPVAPTAPAGLADWVMFDGGTMLPSKTTEELRAGSVVGATPPAGGSVIAAAGDLPNTSAARFTLDPQIQGIAAHVLTDLVDRPAGGAFAKLSYSFPADGAHVSLVVLDLRQPDAQGAIRAAVGVPEPPRGLSAWDTAAAAFDGQSPLPPGAPAWTGRGSHHTPGSAWKLLTALTLIEAATGQRLSPVDAVELRRVLTGDTAAATEAVLGEGTLTADGGICVPLERGTLAHGAMRDGCPAGYFPQPIQDSGQGGPLRDHPKTRFGLAEAIGRSSNIWFIAAMLKLDSDLADGPLAVDLRTMADKLGLLDAASLDGGLGLVLTQRDRAQLDVLSENGNTQTLALAAFGQTVQAGPLILAQLAAAIATGNNVRPSLFAPIPAGDSLLGWNAGPLLDELKRGMRAVVSGQAIGPEDQPGTGAAVFRLRALNQRDRIAGKTGTADRNGTLDRISTFAGWLEAENSGPAFAVGCSVTVLGVRSEGRVDVPPLCAHLTAELMRRLDEEILAP